jgi:hypothetical protein
MEPMYAAMSSWTGVVGIFIFMSGLAFIVYLIATRLKASYDQDDHKLTLGESIGGIGNGIETMNKQLCKMEFDLLRLLILNDHIPRYERMRIYDVYKSKGGNSWLDSWVDTNLRAKGADNDNN